MATTIRRLVPRNGATDVGAALETIAREALQGLEDEDLAVSFGVWDDDGDVQFVCKVETPPGDPLSSEPPWRWWSPLFRTPEELRDGAGEDGRAAASGLARRRRRREAAERRGVRAAASMTSRPCCSSCRRRARRAATTDPQHLDRQRSTVRGRTITVRVDAGADGAVDRNRTRQLTVAPSAAAALATTERRAPRSSSRCAATPSSTSRCPPAGAPAVRRQPVTAAHRSRSPSCRRARPRRPTAACLSCPRARIHRRDGRCPRSRRPEASS